MPGCYITGQAAGAAAAMAVQAGTRTRGIDVRELQRRLKTMGAYLPNFGNSCCSGCHPEQGDGSHAG
jgi:hypothetical protein